MSYLVIYMVVTALLVIATEYVGKRKIEVCERRIAELVNRIGELEERLHNDDEYTHYTPELQEDNNG